MYRVIIFFLIANIFVLLSNIPLFISIRRTPANTIFPLYHSNTPHDYTVYLSVITLGKNGYWLNRDAFTSEKTTPGIFYIFYIFVGKIAGIFHLWPPVAYHLIRFISIEFFLITAYAFCVTILGKRIGFFAALLTLIATISPPFFFGESGAFVTYTPWWGELDAIRRLDALPHHIFGHALLLSSLTLIICSFWQKHPIYLIAAAVSLIIQGIILPPSMFPMLFGLPIVWMMLLILNRRSVMNTNTILRKIFSASNLKLLVILASAALPLFISKWQTQQGYPWILWSEWEINMWNKQVTNFNTAFVLSYGAMAITALPALRNALRTKQPERIFLLVWMFLPIFLLPFMTALGLGKIRLTHSIPFIPISVLSAITLFEEIGKRSVFWIVLVVLVLCSLPITGYLLFLRIQHAQQSPIYSNIFIPTNVWHAISHIGMLDPDDSVVISDEYVGNIIPAFAPVISYFGHINQTLEFFEKQGNVGKFFGARFTQDEARQFVAANRIRYVYYGKDEQSHSPNPLPYSFLTEIFKEEEVIVYEVR